MAKMLDTVSSTLLHSSPPAAASIDPDISLGQNNGDRRTLFKSQPKMRVVFYVMFLACLSFLTFIITSVITFVGDILKNQALMETLHDMMITVSQLNKTDE